MNQAGQHAEQLAGTLATIGLFVVLVLVSAWGFRGLLLLITDRLQEHLDRRHRERHQRYAQLRLRSCTPSPDLDRRVHWAPRHFQCKGKQSEST